MDTNTLNTNNNMADISICEGEGCKIKETCYRFKAKPNEHWQAYIKPDIKSNDCEHFWNLQT